MRSLGLIRALCLSLCNVHLVLAAAIATPAPTKTHVLPRDDDAPIPTFTFGPRENYFPPKKEFPDPSGTHIQIYPTGIYDDFPKEGVTVALGPDLRSQIVDTAMRECKAKTDVNCRNALVPLLQRTDMSTHSKRFAPLAWAGAVVFVALLVQAFIDMSAVSNNAVPQQIKFDYGDLNQIQSMGNVQTFAVVTAADAVPSTISYQPPATTTASETITFETATANSGDHKAGDVVFHIPKDTADRIQDFLGMTGIKETQEKCQNRDTKRADSVQECLRRIRRHSMDLADIGPSNLLQLAPRQMPNRPDPGQAVGFPIENIASEGVLLIIPIYHMMSYEAPTVPNNDGWDPSILAKSAMALTIAAHAAMFAVDGILEIWINKANLATDVKENDLACPKDIICLADDCQGQKIEGGGAFDSAFGVPERIVDTSTTPICITPKNYGCRCDAVQESHALELPREYMDNQYAWLQELIKRAELPDLEPECDMGEQKLDNAAQKFKDAIELACNKNPDLSKTWDYAGGEPGFTMGLAFQKKNGDKEDCDFDCRDIFSMFVKSGSCITGTGLMKNGAIKTDCGNASYLAYKLGIV